MLAEKPSALSDAKRLSQRVHFERDGTVSIASGKVELGQGILTALAQIAADELDVPLEKIRILPASTAHSPDEGVTSGSLSIQDGGKALRIACAELRALFMETAAKVLRLKVSELQVESGVVRGGGESVTFWELANVEGEIPGAAPLKPASAYRVVGTSAPRLDLPGKFAGRPSYVQDMVLPAMLHGRVVRPPHGFKKLLRTEELKGISIVRDGSFLGVLAEREQDAIAAAAKLRAKCTWEEGAPVPGDIHAWLKQHVAERHLAKEKSDPAAKARGTRQLRAAYTKPYIAHASIGPSCALARWKGERLEVWTHSQGVYPLRGTMARALGMKPPSIRCVHMEGAGCYGHNGADDVALDAALIARATNGRPVRVQWMRAEEFMWEPYGAAMTMQAKGAVADGRIVDWNYDVWSQSHNMRPGDPDGINLLSSWYLADPKPPGPARQANAPNFAGDRNAIPTYDLPRQKITHHLIKDSPLRTSALRTLGGYANVFAVESFMDELAAAAGVDPVAFRLAHSKDPRERAVIEAAAKAANWKPGEKGNGVRGLGIAYARYKTIATYNAVVAEVEVDRDSGRIRVPRIWNAVDAGLIINPDGLINQIEGGIIQSASWSLYEHVRFDRDGIKSRDWATYPIMRMPDVPKIETVLLNRPNDPALGAGEASQGPTAAAIANAFAAATGRRLRELPFDPARVKAVLA